MLRPPAWVPPASDAWPLTSSRPWLLTLVLSFASRLWPHQPGYPATTTSADFSLRLATSGFHPQGEISPGKNALLHHTTAESTPPRLDHKRFAVFGALAPLGSAFYPVPVHWLVIYDPRFLPTLGRPHAVALHFARCDQLAGGLAPPGVRPCWAHQKKPPSCERRIVA